MTPTHSRRENYLQLLKYSQPVRYNTERCNDILATTSRITLPGLADDLPTLKKYLTHYHRLTSQDPTQALRTTFLNLHNAFTIIREREKNPTTQKKLAPIYEYLTEYAYYFKLLLDNQNSTHPLPALEKAENILYADINRFTNNYNTLLNDDDNDALNYNTPLPKLNPEDTENTKQEGGDEE